MSNEQAAEIKNKLFQGFQTWDSTSVLSHILMPYGLSLRLGFKDYAFVYNNVSVLRNVIFGEVHDDGREILTPGLRSYDGTYTEVKVDFTGISAMVRTAANGDDIYILIEPLRENAHPTSVFIEGCMLWNREGSISRKGDFIQVKLPDKTINVYTIGEELPDYYVGATSPYINVSLKDKVLFSTQKVSLAEGEKIINSAKEKIEKKVEKYGDLSECFKGMMSVISWETVYEPNEDRVFSTVSRLWSRPAGGYAMFGWDMLFTALMFAEEEKELAYTNVFAILNEATNRGFIPNYSCGNLFKSYDHSQPPVGSLVVRKIYEKYQEKWFLEETFDKLYAWNTWYYENRREKSGTMCWGSDNVWPEELSYFKPSKHDWQGAAYESGLDNSPMFDGVPFNKQTNMLELSDVGLMGLFIKDSNDLAYIAKEIGRYEEYAILQQRKEEIERALQTLWNEEFGFFLNKRTDTKEFSYCTSPTNFYALFADINKAQREKILKHFYNEEEFYGEFMLPSVAKNDPACVEQDYWRGSIWPPMNYLVYEALKQQGEEEAASVLAEKSKSLFLKEWLQCRHIHENYNHRTGMGCGAPKKNSEKFYNWGGLLALIAIKEQKTNESD